MTSLPRTMGKKVVAREMQLNDRDDDWGNEQLGEDLLPM